MKKIILTLGLFLIVMFNLWADEVPLLNEEQQEEVRKRIESWDIDVPEVFWDSELRIKGGTSETYKKRPSVKDVFRDVVFFKEENLDGSITFATIEPIQVKGNEVILSFEIFREFNNGRKIVDNAIYFYFQYYKDENYSYLYKIYLPSIMMSSTNGYEIVFAIVAYASHVKAMGIE